MKTKTSQPVDHKKEIIKMVENISHGRRATWEIWQDFLYMASCALSNPVDRVQAPEREVEYLRLAKRYEKDELEGLTGILGHLILALEERTTDVLGECYMELELFSRWKGQFFTPWCVAVAMAEMNLGGVDKMLETQEFVTILEPAIGSGVMIIAALDVLKRQGVNYQERIHVTGIDIDPVVLHMAYIQLSLLNVPAVLCEGNALSMEYRATWLTPAHVLGLWDYKLRKASDSGEAKKPKPAEPVRLIKKPGQQTLF